MLLAFIFATVTVTKQIVDFNDKTNRRNETKGLQEECDSIDEKVKSAWRHTENCIQHF